MNTTNPRTCSTYLLIFGLVRIFMNSKLRFLFDKLIRFIRVNYSINRV